MEWTLAEDLKIKELYEGGKTFLEISVVLNEEYGNKRTRSSVAGRVSRMGLPKRVVVKKPKVEKPYKPKVVKEKKSRKRRVINDNKQPSEYKSCRYPFGTKNYTFCGQEVFRKWCCRSHYFLCYWLDGNSRPV